MFLDNDDWKPEYGLLAPMPTPRKERPYDREEGLLAGISDQIPNPIPRDNKECQHEKVYARYVLMTFPIKRPWICSLCGEEGFDYEDRDAPSYENIKRKFKK